MGSSVRYLLRSFCTSIRYTVGALHRVVMGYVVSVWKIEKDRYVSSGQVEAMAIHDIYKLSFLLLPANPME